MRGALVCLAAACAPPPATPELPSRGGPAWTELTSEHFTVWTDGPRDKARELIVRMEHLRQVVYGVSYFNEVSNSRAFVVAFANVEEVHAYVPKQFTGYAMGNTPLWQPAIVLPLDELDRPVVTHEIAHVISFNALPEQPHWFAEGLATYFETVRLDEERGTVDVGVPVDGRVATLRREGTLPLERLYSCDAPSCMDARYYATAWAVFAYLVQFHQTELVAYMNHLHELPPGALGTRRVDVLPDPPIEKLQHELAEWLAYGKVLVHEYKVKLGSSSIAERTLADADALAARGLVHARFMRELPPEAIAARDADPTNVLARMIEMSRTGPLSTGAAQHVAEAHPDDWRAWFLVLRAFGRGPEAQAAHDKMCALLPKNPANVPKQLCAP